MIKSNFLSILFTILIYSFAGYIVVAVLINFFPALMVIILAGLAVSAVIAIVNRFRFTVSEMETKRKFDEYGHRRIKAEVVEINDSVEKIEKESSDKDKHS